MPRATIAITTFSPARAASERSYAATLPLNVASTWAGITRSSAVARCEVNMNNTAMTSPRFQLKRGRLPYACAALTTWRNRGDSTEHHVN